MRVGSPVDDCGSRVDVDYDAQTSAPQGSAGVSDAGSRPTWANEVDRREECSKAGQPTRGAVAVDRSAASQFAGGGPAAGKPAASRPGGRGFEADRSAAGQSVSFDYASRMGTVRERVRQALKVQMPSKPVLVAIAVLMAVCIVLGVVAVRGVFDTGVVITRGSDYVTQSNEGDAGTQGGVSGPGSDASRAESSDAGSGADTAMAESGGAGATVTEPPAGVGAPGAGNFDVSVQSVESTDASMTSSSSTNDAYICIYVAGSVTNPGVYNLAEGSRVYEAIEMAGGAAPGADLASINLAKPLTDAEMVYVPAEGETPSASYAAGAAPTSAAGGTQASGPVNINTAGVEELKTLNGIGDSLAQAIVDDRERNGPFTSVDDLVRVSGIGAKTLARFADKVCV